jgi:hypothetical protein
MVFAFPHEVENPAKRLVQHGGLERVDDELTSFSGRDELGLPEQIEMIGDAGCGHVELGRDFAGAQVSFLQFLENAPPSGVAQGLEQKIH